jgi:CO dehydrogenase/acetyl-CoA synthase beta subunit
LVRFQKRLARKRYLNSKRVYEYERISLHIPKEFHETIKPYLKEDLDLKVATEKGSLILILTPLKMLRHAANDPVKTQQKTSEQT